MGASKIRAGRVQRAANLLTEKARKFGNFAFLSLASAIKDISGLSGLEVVTEAIDKMTEDLKVAITAKK